MTPTRALVQAVIGLFLIVLLLLHVPLAWFLVIVLFVTLVVLVGVFVWAVGSLWRF